jgi:aspartyl protease family protein
VAENGDGLHVPGDPLVTRIVAFLLALLPAAAWAAEVNVVGFFPGKAVVVIDGSDPRVMSVGQKLLDITLLSVDNDTKTATFLIDGQKKTLKIGQHQAGPARAPSAQSATLTANAQGHFVVEGQINGGSIRFLVDTGATAVSLSSSDANRLGIDYSKGQPGLMGTANGTTVAYKVTLASVRVGDIVVNNVEAAVLEGNQMPFALLGMSFLNRMEMRREGQVMVLTRRF